MSPQQTIVRFFLNLELYSFMTALSVWGYFDTSQKKEKTVLCFTYKKSLSCSWKAVWKMVKSRSYGSVIAHRYLSYSIEVTVIKPNSFWS